MGSIANHVREGSLEAPARRPLDWKHPTFWDEAALEAELSRVFDICHGCRRCVSLCGAFPALFDLVDASPTLELDGVDKAEFSKVVEQCYLCDLCYMTKCPYVPPHEWNLDFPHLMLRAKAVGRKRGGGKLRDAILSSTDRTGLFAGIPVVTRAINAVNRARPMRRALEAALGVDAQAWLPQFAPRTFRQQARGDRDDDSAPVVDGARTPGKVALYATCFIQYNEPGIGLDLAAVLGHNGIPWRLLDKEACCGMPKLEQGDLDGVAALKEVNIPRLAALARSGYAILTPTPSCTLMYKQELPLMYPDDEDVKAVQTAMWDPFEYFVARHRDGLLKTDFKHALGTIAYHIPCHGRVQNIGRKTEEMLRLLPGAKVETTERCSGHAGTFGVKKAFHAMAMKIGKPVFKRMSEIQPDFISSDCPLGGHHIAQGIANLGGPAPELAHPLTLLRRAYGI
ncbi:MAG: Fe-S oxidoreductase [Betaproteobacteria bacterium]|nr:Fe-S oxidoreductase [Betaproteobacteria bacterium]